MNIAHVFADVFKEEDVKSAITGGFGSKDLGYKKRKKGDLFCLVFIVAF